MKKIQLLFIAIAVLSCKKTETAAPPAAATTVEVTVTDGRTGTAASGATVLLYDSADAVTSNTSKYTATTDQTGAVKIPVAYIAQYFVIAQKGSEKNYYNGLIPTGIFKTQADIQNSAIQTPAAVIGGVNFQDTNGDGRITAADDVSPPDIKVTANANNAISTSIY
jgi:hypothetical protein